MRVLVLTNFYPPYVFGGMEMSCLETVDGLRSRGHAVNVVTSVHGIDQARSEGHIHRQLALEMELAPFSNAWRFFLSRKSDEEKNLESLGNQIRAFEPDVLFIWGMWNLPRSLAAEAERLMGGRVLYRLADYWPSLPSQHVHYWTRPGKGPLARAVKRILAPMALRQLKGETPAELAFPHAYCVSKAVLRGLLREGVPVAHASIIYTGLDLSLFDLPASAARWEKISPRDVLFAGRLSPEKGAHVLIEAIARLKNRNHGTGWRLTLAGGGDHEYLSYLSGLVSSLRLKGDVRFLGPLPPEAIPPLMQEHGTVVVPSVWEEPLPRTAIEAMAAGCVVVGSRVGGLPEILTHERTGLLTDPGDPEALADVLAKLDRVPGLARRLAAAGRQMARDKFTMKNELDQVEMLLERAAQASTHAG